MKINAILFDLDGTLLPMDQDVFIKTYFKLLAGKLAPYGYEPQKLLDSIWASVGAMVKNDGKGTNETAFWNMFTSIYGEKSLEDKPVFECFYAEDFDKVQASCGYTPAAKEIIEFLHNKGLMLVLATNPLFPAVATRKRIKWAGLSPEDFTLYTTYENAGFCKPNPKYYQEILEKIGCQPEECVMIGNDVAEDMVAETLGMNVFLLTDCLINKTGVDITQYPHGSFPELKEYLSSF